MKKVLISVIALLIVLTVFLAALPEELIIYHWWTAGGEREAIEAAFKVFKKYNPEIKIVENPVAGGAGAVMKPAIWGMLISGNPPDTYQVHAGGELKEYVDAGFLDTVDEIWAETGLEVVVPETLRAMVRFGGHYYAVPINVHRSNVLYYSPKIFNELGVLEKYGDPRNWDLKTLLDVLRFIKEKKPDVDPFGLGTREKWPLTHVFEVLLLLHAGPENYVKFWTGKFNYKDPEDPVWAPVKDVLKFLATLEHEKLVNFNHPEVTWDEAAAGIAKGETAMLIQGDWVVGWYIAGGFKYGEDWMAVPFPKKIFILLSDCFNLPIGAPHRDATIAWLKAVASKELQKEFNLVKGSIPARVDVDIKYPDPYRPETAEDFKTATLVPSPVHGALSKEGFVTEMHNILTGMLASVRAGADVDIAVNAALAQIKGAIDRTGLPDFWKEVGVDYFITTR